MNEIELKRTYNFPVHPRGFKIYTIKRFVNIDDGSMGGIH